MAAVTIPIMGAAGDVDEGAAGDEVTMMRGLPAMITGDAAEIIIVRTIESPPEVMTGDAGVDAMMTGVVDGMTDGTGAGMMTGAAGATTAARLLYNKSG